MKSLVHENNMGAGASRRPTVSEAQLASVLDTAVDGIVVIDDHATILSFNKACETLFGFKAEDVIGKNVHVLMPSEFAVHHDGYISNYLTTGHRKIIGIGREVRGQHKNGKHFPFELSVGEAHTPEGRQFIGIVRDLSKRKETEARIAELQDQLLHMSRVSAVDEMGAAIAHELNQPLTALMLYLQAARKRLSAQTEGVDQRALDIIDKAAKEAGRAGDIIQRMRSFIEQRAPDRSTVRLRTLVDEALELTVIGTRTTSARMVSDDVDDDLRVSCDPVQIQQIVVNLIRNALQAVQDLPNAQITTSCRRQDNWAILGVQDSGPGIPDEIVKTLFQAFSTTKRRGLGLGLAISRSIAQSHGGDLEVHPGGNGVGARFDLKLPLASGVDEVPTSA